MCYLVSGMSVPVLQQYTHLVLPMPADLELDVIAQDRKEKVSNAYHAMNHS